MRTREREARANCGPLPQSVRTICRSAAFWQARGGHSRRRAASGRTVPGCRRHSRPDPVQDERGRCRSRPQRSAILRTEWRKHRKMPTVGRGAPGALRAFPAVGAHRLRAVGGRQRACLLGTLSVRGLQRVGRGRIGHGRAEDAAASHRGRDIDLVSERPVASRRRARARGAARAA